jgi:hypothetical protein
MSISGRAVRLVRSCGGCLALAGRGDVDNPEPFVLIFRVVPFDQTSSGVTQKLAASNRETPCQRRRITGPKHTRTLPRTA